MKWHRIHLTNEQIKSGVVRQIQDQFMHLLREAKAPKDAAMFDDKMPTSKGKNIYFSPAATKFMIDIINQFLGEEAERPNIDEVALLVGQEDVAWGLLR